MRFLGYNLKTERDKLYSRIGVCPQENILYDLLTVRDHFDLFAEIRNEKGDNSNNEITQLLTDLDLTEYKDTLVKNLSGGNKRKL